MTTKVAPAERLLQTAEAALDAGDAAEAARALDAAEAHLGARDGGVLYLRGSLAWQTQGPAAARRWFEDCLAVSPRDADAHHALARLCEEEGDAEGQRTHDLEVLALDAHRGMREGKQLEALRAWVADVARDFLETLPEPFAARLAAVPVVLESRPAKDLVADGFDPRALGLFEGPVHGDTALPAPSRIVLYIENLLADAEDEEQLADEVEVTLLHEIGHYFGLGEDDLERLGLD